MPNALSATQIDQALANLAGWSVADGKLTKTWKLADFKQALGFITQIGLYAEQQNHHPELFNVYSTVTIALSTHDAGDAITEYDINLANAIETIKL